MESLQPEVAPFGISTTIVDPGFYRTELLTPESTTYAKPSIDDYTERNAQQLEWWKAQHGQQLGDPAKLARALVDLAHGEPPPRRLIAGSDVIGVAEAKAAELQERSDLDRRLAASLALSLDLLEARARPVSKRTLVRRNTGAGSDPRPPMP